MEICLVEMPACAYIGIDDIFEGVLRRNETSGLWKRVETALNSIYFEEVIENNEA